MKGQDVGIHTTAGMQGSQAKIAVLALPAANSPEKEKVGFMGQFEQINVELTRAQWGLIAIGNFSLWWSATGSLRKKSKTFASLVDDLYEKKDVHKYNSHNPDKVCYQTALYDTSRNY